jgi:hypothetical protein
MYVCPRVPEADVVMVTGVSPSNMIMSTQTSTTVAVPAVVIASNTSDSLTPVMDQNPAIDWGGGEDRIQATEAVDND